MLIGYTRPYYEDPNCDSQVKYLAEWPCQKVLQEEHSSAKRRTELDNMIAQLCHGDKIIVTKLFILADSTRHLVELLEAIEAKGAFIHSLKEGIDTSDAGGYRFTDIVKHLVDFQSDVISEKTRSGVHEAKQKGIAPGRPRKPDENVKKAIRMYQSKQYSLKEIKEETGISKSTLYRYLES
ncbi:recombinase family protein [Pseudobacillus wudalianchiensis]|uniref:Resolvase n=1 Tax=Pseudobacillus wudalianchiensis TaxID=1743143 RepID=A0A1B9ABP6_9BACI|nr:recombinase family protein [Bacillus wudalianchiensis]OCA81249.1 resolvase [Bacillus wudalianchiensis]